jgi:hypothetical protein
LPLVTTNIKKIAAKEIIEIYDPKATAFQPAYVGDNLNLLGIPKGKNECIGKMKFTPVKKSCVYLS